MHMMMKFKMLSVQVLSVENSFQRFIDISYIYDNVVYSISKEITEPTYFTGLIVNKWLAVQYFGGWAEIEKLTLDFDRKTTDQRENSD